MQPELTPGFQRWLLTAGAPTTATPPLPQRPANAVGACRAPGGIFVTHLCGFGLSACAGGKALQLGRIVLTVTHAGITGLWSPGTRLRLSERPHCFPVPPHVKQEGRKRLSVIVLPPLPCTHNRWNRPDEAQAPTLPCPALPCRQGQSSLAGVRLGRGAACSALRGGFGGL